MRGKWIHTLCSATILLGIVGPSTALSSHLDSPSISPASHQDQDSQNTTTQIHTKPEKIPLSTIPTQNHAQSENPPTAQTLEQRTQKSKPHTKFAWRLLLKGRYKAAVSAYRNAIKKNPHAATSYVGLGIALTNLGNVDTAKKAFLKAIDLDPRLSSALVHLGYLYTQGHFGLEETKTGLQLFRQASKLGDPFADIALLDMKSHSKL